MNYISTRGKAPKLAFDEVVLAGLASDGGLYVPAEIPFISPAELARWRELSYPELAVRVISPFTAGVIETGALERMINESYASFRHAAIAPLTQIGRQEWLLELFHGPTLAFKDFALQLLGRLVDHLLEQRGETGIVLGATSGDTGSAALAAVAGRDRLKSFILYPHGRVSDVQRRQMTTMLADNIHCIALDGTFDDCQDHVKALFADAEFRSRHPLVAVNSINWARILAQVVYYFYAGLQLGAPAQAVSFSVPTGNFGDIFAGYIAKQMGLPIDQLIIASNRNDILTRCFNTGTYALEGVSPSLSPSMDIQISSNFERLLFDLYDRDGAALAGLMQQFRETKSLTLHDAAHRRLKTLFAAASVDDELTMHTIAELYQQTGYLADPHTAVGIAAGRAVKRHADVPLVILATAHPAKFPDAVVEAAHIHPPLPSHLADLFSREERLTEMPNDVHQLRAFIEAHA